MLSFPSFFWSRCFVRAIETLSRIQTGTTVCSVVPATHKTEAGEWLELRVPSQIRQHSTSPSHKKKRKKISWLSQQKKDMKLCAPVTFKMVNPATYNHYPPNCTLVWEGGTEVDLCGAVGNPGADVGGKTINLREWLQSVGVTSS